MPTIRFNGTREQLNAKLRDIPAILAGKKPDVNGAVAQIKRRLAKFYLKKIREAYLVKAEGGTGSDGIQWDELSPVTLALREAKPSYKLLKEKYGKHSSARLRSWNKQAKKIYDVLNRKDEKSRKSALKVLEKQYGAGNITTVTYDNLRRKLELMQSKSEKEAEVFVGGFTQILIDTKRMVNSLVPDSADNIIKIGPGYVEVGSKVPYMKYHTSSQPRKLKNDGSPRLPRRQILPDVIPESWRQEALQELKKAMLDGEFLSRYLQT